MLKTDWVKYIRGDRSAFRKMYETYVDDLFAFGMSIYGNREMILDCIHDIFLDIYGNPRIAEEVNVKFYLFSALRRRVLKLKKQEGLYIRTEEQTIAHLQDIFSENSIEEELILNETTDATKTLILKSLAKLPKRQREIIHLRYYMDFSYEEISKIMNVNIGTCRTLSYRAIKLLKQQLPSLGQLLFLFFLLK